MMKSRELMVPSIDGGAIPLYVVFPERMPAPAVIMIPAVHGVNAGAKDWLARYADHGFLAAAPDLFWRTIPGPMEPLVPEQHARALERATIFDRDLGVADIAAVRDAVLAMPECTGTWAAAGYCFGGSYTLVAGGMLGADAVVAFHPSRMETELDAAAQIAVPLSFHCGGADDHTPPELIATLRDIMAHDPRAEFVVYPGVKHGFTGKGRPAYDEHAAETSFARALDVLATLRKG